MKVLVIDTESTGKQSFKHDLTDPIQPRIVSIFAGLFDETGQCLKYVESIVYPEGFEIDNNSEACQINRITQATAINFGVRLDELMLEINEMAEMADGLVAHNMTFDAGMLKIEAAHRNADWAIRKLPRFCTMKTNVTNCKVPYPTKRAGYKYPSLQETYQHYFGEPIQGAHDAKTDGLACMKIFFRMKEMGLPTEFIKKAEVTDEGGK